MVITKKPTELFENQLVCFDSKDVDESGLFADACIGINLDGIVENYNLLRAMSHPAECSAVVKANAYGCGSAIVAKKLYSVGCRTFFVASFSEGIRLRKKFDAQDATIGILGGLLIPEIEKYESYRLTPVLNTVDQIIGYGEYCEEHNKKLPAFIHIDTGMNRLGLIERDLEVLRDYSHKLSFINVIAWMTHFACADEEDGNFCEDQYTRFNELLKKFDISNESISICNSSGIFAKNGKYNKLGLNRPGVALYGGNPTPWTKNPMVPVVSLFARIQQNQFRKKGDPIGYNSTYVTPKSGYYITVGIGYADGWMRALSGKGYVTTLKSGIRLPIIGRVSMDLITCDASHVDINMMNEIDEGQFVKIISEDYPVDQVANDAGTISYEVLTSIGGARYRRLYFTKI
ncbi:hypothetical protein SNEBB_002174 [Seison nebaliae]|nr:hypothetical protein SNEBB_002174 [Seison nebaliae]